MTDIDNAIALGVKPQPPQDVIGPITSLAQIQYLQAHGSLENAQAQFQQGKLGALQQYGDMVNSGMSPESAITPSLLGAYDPPGANAMLSNIAAARSLQSNAAYAKSGDPNSLAIQGPAAVTAGAGASQSLADLNAKQQYASTGDPAFLRAISPESYTAGVNAVKAQGDVALQQLTLGGQIASGVLALGDVNGNPPPGGIPPEIRQDAVNKAVSMGRITPQQAAQEAQMSDGDFWNVVKAWAGAGQGAKDAAEMSGRAAAAQAAGRASNTPIVMGVTQGLHAPPPSSALPASGAAVSAGARTQQVQLAILGQESSNQPNAPTSIDGAKGPGQILPSTFRAYALPGESINNPDDNRAVSGRIIADYMQRYNGDPARVATAYFSGPGNVAPPGSPVPWKNNYKDGNGKYVSEYVHDMAGRLGTSGPTGTPAPGTAATAPTPLQGAAAVPVPPIAPIALAQNRSASLAPPPAPGTVSPIAPAPVPGAVASPTPPPPGAVAYNPTTGHYLTPATRNRDGSPAPPIATAGGVVQDNAAGAANIAAREAAASPQSPNNSGWITPPAMTLQQKAFTEALGTGAGKMQTDQLTKAKEDNANAATGQMKLGELMASLDDMPKSGFLTQGPGAADRTQFAKIINTTLQGAGASPMFDPKAVGDAENAQKLTGGLGFDLSRSMGAKEPGSITERAIKLNPGIENSPVGAKIIAGAMNADLQRKRDFYQFLSGNDNSPTADIEFNKLHPPQQYIKEAQTLAMTPSSDVKLLLQYANDPRAVSAFDQKYGNGMSRYFTGQ